MTILPNRSMARVCSRQATSFVCRRNLRSRFKGMASRLGGSSPAPLVPTLQCIARLRPNDSRSTSRRRRSAPKGWGCPGCERTRSSDSNAAPSPILARRRSYTNDSSEPDTLQTRFQFQPQSNPKVERRPKPESRSALGFGLRISAFGLRASGFFRPSGFKCYHAGQRRIRQQRQCGSPVPPHPGPLPKERVLWRPSREMSGGLDLSPRGR